MTTSYQISFESPTAQEFLQLRMLIGWSELDVNMAKRSLSNSLFHVVIRSLDENKTLLAMARVVGDGAMYFYIQDVLVSPNVQNIGLGKLLMEHIEHYLDNNACVGATIGLLAAKGKEPFYQQFGYKLRPDDALGNGMCKFIT